MQIRCLDIAGRLGCSFVLGKTTCNQIPSGFSIFVCVKPGLGRDQLVKLSKRGTVIWDIIDRAPFEGEGATLFLASTRSVQKLFSSRGRVEYIPHHHCNFTGEPNTLSHRRPAWIGAEHWHPKLTGIDYDYYDSNGMDREGVVAAYRKMGLGLNLRSRTTRASLYHKYQPNHDQHITMNSGIKLINCIGFGIPSLSADEPAYREIGADCTIFSSIEKCAADLRDLQVDYDKYLQLRMNCLERAQNFHIDTIAEMYKTLLCSL